jgi:hypothetical protein
MASNLLYFKITRKLLQNYFGSAFRELGTVFIVITIRTKFPDSKEMSFIKIYISRVNSEAGTRARKRLVGSIARFSS